MLFPEKIAPEKGVVIPDETKVGDLRGRWIADDPLCGSCWRFTAVAPLDARDLAGVDGSFGSRRRR
jgi:hypothetical protein